MGYPLYGQELTLTRTPIEAGLKWACDLDGGFVGADAAVLATHMVQEPVDPARETSTRAGKGPTDLKAGGPSAPPGEPSSPPSRH